MNGGVLYESDNVMFEKVEFTNMCMICDGDKVLVQNKVNCDWAGITFPGGHVEKGESFTDAVIREVLEETGLKISSPQLCGVKDWSNEDGSRYMVLLYRTNKFEGNLTSSEEGEVYWLSLEEMARLRLADGMDKMLTVFLNEDISELFFYKQKGEWKSLLK